jgi:hypothetical protein
VITNDKSMFFAHSIEGLIISKHLDLNSSPPVNYPYKLQPQGFCNHPVNFSVCVLRQWSNEYIANCLKEIDSETRYEEEKAQRHDDSCSNHHPQKIPPTKANVRREYKEENPTNRSPRFPETNEEIFYPRFQDKLQKFFKRGK